MPETIDKRPSLRALFWELVNKVWPSSPLPQDLALEDYLVRVLERHWKLDSESLLHEPLMKKLQECCNEREVNLFEIRRIGDAALFVAGFFGPHAQRKSVVGIRHYLNVGEAAYEILLLHFERGKDSVVFEKMSEDLAPFAAILEDIRQECEKNLEALNPLLIRAMPDPSQTPMEDILRKWDEYVRTHDERTKAWLENRGIRIDRSWFDAMKQKM